MQNFPSQPAIPVVIGAFFYACVLIGLPETVLADPASSFGLNAPETARAMTSAAAGAPVSAAAANPAKLSLQPPASIDAIAGFTAAFQNLQINHQDANLDPYYGYFLGVSAALPIGQWKDRLFVGFDMHLPHQGPYQLHTSEIDEPIVLRFGPDARRITLHAALAARVWKSWSIGLGAYMLPDVTAMASLSFEGDNSASSADVEVRYRFAPAVGIYGQIIDGISLGIVYRAGMHLSLDVPANIFLNDAIGSIHARLAGNAYSEPHTLSIGLSADFSAWFPSVPLSWNIEASWRHYDVPISTASKVWLYDDSGTPLEEPVYQDEHFNEAWDIATSLTYKPIPEIELSAGYGFSRTAVPAQHSVFNVLDADRNQISAGIAAWMPKEWLSGFTAGISLSGRFDIYSERTMEKYEYLPQNKGFPAIAFKGYTFALHTAILLHFE